MKKIFVLVLLLSVFTLSSCWNNNSIPDENWYINTQDSSDSWISTALSFHIKTAAEGLRDSVTLKETYPIEQANIDFIVSTIKFAQMTLPQAITIAEEDWKTEIAKELTDYDARITAVISWTPVIWNVVDEVETVALWLENLLK